MTRIPLALLAALCLQGTPLPAQQPATQTVSVPAAGKVTSPKEQFGFNIGDDYHLANYKQLTDYWRKLDAESDRMVLHEMGKTAEGRTQLMAIVTSPANHRNLARYKEIARRLALAEGLTDDQARALAKEGKAIVWIDGGLHATEVLGAQQLMETLHQVVSGNDDETLRFLDNTIMLFVHANPDGHDLVADWYMRNPNPQQRSTGGIPKLYQKYIGHDNNRDFFGSTQPETENMNRVMYREWYPQIVYNHHQTGPAGTVMFAPPFRDPFNYNYDALIPVGIDLVGAAMHNRFALEGKGGITSRSGASYSTWWNGGLRTTAYFHNMIGLLTETIGNPTPIEIPFIARQQLPRADLPLPIAPQTWHFRQSIDYSVTANRAVLDVASKMKENFLFNIYKMGKNSIERGSRDTWTTSPRRIARAEEIMRAAGGGGGRGAGGGGGGRGGGNNAAMRAAQDSAWKALRDPAMRDPRGFILSANQPDFLTATKFVNALLETGVAVHQATAQFTVNGKSYPAGSYVVMANQAFRPHVMDMFEPQDHPDDFPYPGAAPSRPYDVAGWTLAYEMGVQFDRVLEGFTGPFRKIEDWNIKAPAGRVSTVQNAAGYFTSHEVNDAFNAVNKLLRANEEVYWLRAPVTANGKTYPVGTLYIASKGTTLPALQRIAADLGVSFEGTTTKPTGDAFRLKKPRVALWDQYGGSMTAGWNRWVLEQFDFEFDRVFPPQLDAGNLNAKYDVIIFSSGGEIPGVGGGGGGGRGGGGGGAGAGAQSDADLPAEYRNQRGNITADKTIPILRQFVENGGTIIALDASAANLAEHFGLPISDHLVENGQPLGSTKFYVPGSVLRARLDNTHPLGHGLPAQIDVFFDNSPTFKLGPDAAAKGVKPIMWFEGTTPLRSGWAWGQNYLDRGVAAVEATMGKGKVFLFGPEVNQRGQTHGTFKLLFNGIYYGSATPTRM